MPGVADAIRKTNLQQDQQKRKQEMDQLLKMVREGRLHEADERQLEMLKLALDLNTLLDRKNPESSPVPTFDAAVLTAAIKDAVNAAIQNAPIGDGVFNSAAGGARPEMKHTSLTDFAQTTDDVAVSHGDELGETKTGTDDSANKLERLKKLKGGS